MKTNNIEQEFVRVNSEFWSFDKDGNVSLDIQKFIDFLDQLGFRKIYRDNKVIYIYIKNNIAQEVVVPKIKDHVISYIKNIPGYSDSRKNKIIKAMLNNISKYFNEKLIDIIKGSSLNMMMDDKDNAYIYFENTIVHIKKNSAAKTIPYSSLNKPIWKQQIKSWDFKKLEANKQKSEFEQFIWNISNKEVNRFQSICSAIGYLLHRHKNRSQAKAIILMDEKISIDQEPHGRSGKSIIGRAVSYLRNTQRIDGRNFEFNDRFTFQQVNLQTEIVEFNDVKNRFSIERLFSVITDDMNVEPKGVNKYSIPFETSPKFLISTNYALKGTGPSFRDRMFEIELCDYYNESHKPIDDFGHHLFDDWNDDEWNRYYNFMCECILLYLNNGLIHYERKNVLKKKLLAETSQEFIAFVEKNLEITKEYNKKSFYELFIDNSNSDSGKKLSQVTFSKYIKAYASYSDFGYIDRRSNGHDYFTFTNK